MASWIVHPGLEGRRRRGNGLAGDRKSAVYSENTVAGIDHIEPVGVTSVHLQEKKAKCVCACGRQPGIVGKCQVLRMVTLLPCADNKAVQVGAD